MSNTTYSLKLINENGLVIEHQKTDDDLKGLDEFTGKYGGIDTLSDGLLATGITTEKVVDAYIEYRPNNNKHAEKVTLDVVYIPDKEFIDKALDDLVDELTLDEYFRDAYFASFLRTEQIARDLKEGLHPTLEDSDEAKEILKAAENKLHKMIIQACKCPESVADIRRLIESCCSTILGDEKSNYKKYRDAYFTAKHNREKRAQANVRFTGKASGTASGAKLPIINSRTTIEQTNFLGDIEPSIPKGPHGK